jgi:hypothetical protein
VRLLIRNEHDKILSPGLGHGVLPIAIQNLQDGRRSGRSITAPVPAGAVMMILFGIFSRHPLAVQPGYCQRPVNRFGIGRFIAIGQMLTGYLSMNIGMVKPISLTDLTR